MTSFFPFLLRGSAEYEMLLLPFLLVFSKCIVFTKKTELFVVRTATDSAQIIEPCMLVQDIIMQHK